MAVKLIITDLDGTLLHTDKSISPYSSAVFARCRAAGYVTAIATARSEASALRAVKALQPDIVVSNGGALVRAGDEVLYRKLLPAQAITKIVKTLLAQNAAKTFTLACPGGYYVSYKTLADHPDYAHGAYFDFKNPVPEDGFKLSAELTDRSVIPALMAELPACKFMEYTGDAWCSFSHAAANKELAVQALAERLGIVPGEIAAFGDDYNDVGLLKLCGTGVAMENAVQAAKEAARFSCPSNDADGVARWLEENLLHAV